MDPVRPPAAQASQVTFALHTLGWKAFQSLCSTIASEIWGQTAQVFADTRDGGRDGAFYGEWHRQANELYSGTFTVQCKFTSKPDSSLTRSDLSDEFAKAANLARKGLAENYFLMTNAHVTGTTDEELRGAFESIPGLEGSVPLSV